MAQKMIPASIVNYAKELTNSGIESGAYPFIIFDIDAATERLRQYLSDISCVFKKYSVAYSYKSNNLAQWCQTLSSLGLKAEVCSSDEFKLAHQDGFREFIFDGPLKLSEELELAVDNNVLIEIDNADECIRLEKICQKKGLKCKVHVRLSHYYDENLSRFGLSHNEFVDLYELIISKSKTLTLAGFHLHVGSNLTDSKKICSALLQYAHTLKKYMPENGILNLGSGIPADSFTGCEDTPTPAPIDFFKYIHAALIENIGDIANEWHYIFEPGRHLVEDFGFFVGKITSFKKRYNVEVAQSNLDINWIPSIRTWHHSFTIIDDNNLTNHNNISEYMLAGFNCFESDFLLPSIKTYTLPLNSFFIIRGCGAYDMQTCNEWTRRLYPIYTVSKGIVDIARAHRQESDFRRFDLSLAPDAIQVDASITLAHPELKYAEKLLELIVKDKEEFSKYMIWPKYVNTVQDTRDFIERARTGNQKQSELVLFILYNSKLSGVVSFNQIDSGNKTAYIGYWLATCFQGKGIITRAINKIIDEYSKNKLLTRFVIKCIVSNKKSNNVAVRCGFTLEGVQRKAEILNGIAYDQNLYAKLIS